MSMEKMSLKIHQNSKENRTRALITLEVQN